MFAKILSRSQHLLLCAAALLAFETAVHSYGYDTCLGSPITWSGDKQFRASGVSFPVGSWRTALLASVNGWNNGPSDFDFNLTYDDSSVGLNNTQCEIWFSSDQDILDGAPAICISWNYCFNLAEADIIFDVGESYSTSTTKSNLWPYGGDYRPFRNTAMHELGHGLGLNHEADTYNIMGQDWDHIHANGSTAYSYPGEDGQNGAVYLYGLNSSNPQDLGVVHWEHTGASGAYSTHARTKMYDSSGTVLPSFTDTKYNPEGEKGYQVSRGQVVRVRLSFENNGATTQTRIGRFYISTNDFISTSDTEIGSTNFTLGRNTVYTYDKTLTIPSNLTVGEVYYIGAKIDADSALSEHYESNNATYTAIKIIG